MVTAIYPGTFDPITNGHIELITRSLSIFDEVIVAVAPSKKKAPLFTVEERIKLIEQSVTKLKGARADSFDNLLMDYAEKSGSLAVVRGLRAVSDFEYELQMALMNRRLNASTWCHTHSPEAGCIRQGNRSTSSSLCSSAQRQVNRKDRRDSGAQRVHCCRSDWRCSSPD